MEIFRKGTKSLLRGNSMVPYSKIQDQYRTAAATFFLPAFLWVCPRSLGTFFCAKTKKISNNASILRRGPVELTQKNKLRNSAQKVVILNVFSSFLKESQPTSETAVIPTDFLNPILCLKFFIQSEGSINSKLIIFIVSRMRKTDRRG